MEKGKVLEQLLPELSSFLEIIDQEPLGTTARRKQQLIQTFIQQLKSSSGDDGEYMYMNSISPTLKTLIAERASASANEESAGPSPLKTPTSRTLPRPKLPLPRIPELPTPMSQTAWEGSQVCREFRTVLAGSAESRLPLAVALLPAKDPEEGFPSSPEDHYEEAVSFESGILPEFNHFFDCTSPATASSVDAEGCYEDATYPPTPNSTTPDNRDDSDALSSSYESYEEEEDDGKGQRSTPQWPPPEASLGLAQGSRMCAFMLRKKRFGQWAKQLCVLRGDRLLCYKNSRQKSPQLELALGGCTVAYAVKSGRRKTRHEIRISRADSDPLVLAAASREHAEHWRQVLQEICDPENKTAVAAAAAAAEASGTLPRAKEELEKRCSLETPGSDAESIVTVSSGEGLPSDADGKDGSKAARPGWSLGKATGKRLTQIIGRRQKKKELPESPQRSARGGGSSGDGGGGVGGAGDADASGCLSVLTESGWQECWGSLEGSTLFLGSGGGGGVGGAKGEPPAGSIALHGCRLAPGLVPKHPLAFRLLRGDKEVATLEAASWVETGRWVGLLLATTGCGTEPESLLYEHVDTETSSRFLHAAKLSRGIKVRQASSPNVYTDGPPCRSRDHSPSDDPYENLTRDGALALAATAGGALRSASDGPRDPATPEERAPSECPSVPPAPTPCGTDSGGGDDDDAGLRELAEEIMRDIGGRLLHDPGDYLSIARGLEGGGGGGGGGGAGSSRQWDAATGEGHERDSPAPGDKETERNSCDVDSCSSSTTSSSSCCADASGARGDAPRDKDGKRRAALLAEPSLGQRYGRRRVEADAARLQAEALELQRRRQDVRSRLSELRRERREAREAPEARQGDGGASGETEAAALRLLEERCRACEGERVDLELRLIEVMERLKHALSGGPSLGLTISPRPAERDAVPQVPDGRRRDSLCCDTADSEVRLLPVNSQAAMRRRPLSIYALACSGAVLQKAKEWETKKGT
ncbi:actin filament-associated protein 1-like isoform X1 [Lethenteron reissneri]|uniref:actin filament-associated protein 1-like isoform X1 n=1 Tax=Lethenteron reissneri TaxID=7753 RepID=UPI002AB77637|nr:actin filament-associated protein 1-like isoform X1 [Lethenteron reissneri]